MGKALVGRQSLRSQIGAKNAGVIGVERESAETMMCAVIVANVSAITIWMGGGRSY